MGAAVLMLLMLQAADRDLAAGGQGPMKAAMVAPRYDARSTRLGISDHTIRAAHHQGSQIFWRRACRPTPVFGW